MQRLLPRKCPFLAVFCPSRFVFERLLAGSHPVKTSVSIKLVRESAALSARESRNRLKP